MIQLHYKICVEPRRHISSASSDYLKFRAQMRRDVWRGASMDQYMPKVISAVVEDYLSKNSLTFGEID